jgi:hypothetical protein
MVSRAWDPSQTTPYTAAAASWLLTELLLQAGAAAPAAPTVCCCKCEVHLLLLLLLLVWAQVAPDSLTPTAMLATCASIHQTNISRRAEVQRARDVSWLKAVRQGQSAGKYAAIHSRQLANARPLQVSLMLVVLIQSSSNLLLALSGRLLPLHCCCCCCC